MVRLGDGEIREKCMDYLNSRGKKKWGQADRLVWAIVQEMDDRLIPKVVEWYESLAAGRFIPQHFGPDTNGCGQHQKEV